MLKLLVASSFSLFSFFSFSQETSSQLDQTAKFHYSCERAGLEEEYGGLKFPIYALLNEKNVIEGLLANKDKKDFLRKALETGKMGNTRKSSWSLYDADENYFSYSFFAYSQLSGPKKQVLYPNSDFQKQYIVNTAHPETDSFFRIRRVRVEPWSWIFNNGLDGIYPISAVKYGPWKTIKASCLRYESL